MVFSTPPTVTSTSASDRYEKEILNGPADPLPVWFVKDAAVLVAMIN